MDFSWVSTLWEVISGFFTSIIDYILEFLLDLLFWFFDFYTWLAEESYVLCVNLIVDLLEGCGVLVPDTPYDRAYFISICEKINVFFPIDLLFRLLLILLTTWVAVRMYKLGFRFSLHFIRRGIKEAFR